MSGELAIRTGSSGLELKSLQDVEALGKAMAASGMFQDTRDAAKAVVKILAGQELGIPPVAAMKGIHIVEGKIELSGTMIGALIKRSGRYDYRVLESTDEKCRIHFLQQAAGPEIGWESIGETEWTLQDAARAGLCKIEDGKPKARSRQGAPLPWETYPRAMLFARAIAEGARQHCPDVFGGSIYVEGELSPESVETEPPAPNASAIEEEAAPAVSEPVADEPPAGGDEAQDEVTAPTDATPGEHPSPADPVPEGDTVTEIEKLRDKLKMNQGQLLKFAREKVGKHITRPNWAALSGDDSKVLLEALREKVGAS